MNKAVSRRGFVRAGVASGIAFRIGFIVSAAGAAIVDDPRSQLASWIGPDGRARFRTDAVAKVTGAKTFARDYRSRDLPGWPRDQSHAFLLHATRADAIFDGVDLSLLGEELKPDRLVLGDELLRDGIRPPFGGAVGPPGFYGDVFLVPPGETPRLLGQPVALLIYRDFARFDAARRRLRFADGVVRWGAKSGYARRRTMRGRFVCIAGPTPEAPDVYAPLTGTTSMPFEGDWSSGRPPSAQAMPRNAVMGSRRDRSHDRLGRRRVAGGSAIRHQRSVDASAMEPDNGNAADPSSGALRLMMATQSPLRGRDRHRLDGRGLAHAPVGAQSIDLSIGYTVGYGTKDHSIFPLLSVVAASRRGPSGASRQRPLRAVPDGHQAARLLDRRDAGRRSRDGALPRHEGRLSHGWWWPAQPLA